MADDEKRKPGRPRKVKKSTLPMNGIVDKPSNHGRRSEPYVYEVLYQNPTMFKQILEAFKNAEPLYILFGPTGIKFYADGGGMETFAMIYGSGVNAYYCEEPVEIKIDQADHLRTLLQKAVNYSKIVIRAVGSQRHSHMTVVMEDQENGITSTDTVNVGAAAYPGWDDVERASLQAHWCNFTLVRKLLKRLVKEEISRTGDLVNIRVENGQLFMTHDFTKKMGNNMLEFTKREEMGFTYDPFDEKSGEQLPKSTVMSIKIPTGMFESAAVIDLDEFVTIRCSQDRSLLAVHYLDSTLDNRKRRIENTEKSVIYMLIKQKDDVMVSIL